MDQLKGINVPDGGVPIIGDPLTTCPMVCIFVSGQQLSIPVYAYRVKNGLVEFVALGDDKQPKKYVDVAAPCVVQRGRGAEYRPEEIDSRIVVLNG